MKRFAYRKRKNKSKERTTSQGDDARGKKEQKKEELSPCFVKRNQKEK